LMVIDYSAAFMVVGFPLRTLQRFILYIKER
jgi:hypothetical protein